MTHRTGYWVKCINPIGTRFEDGEVLQVSSVSATPHGALLLGFDNNLAIWKAEDFEEVIVHENYSDAVVVYERPEEMIEITKREYIALLDAENWWHACVMGKVTEYCGWSNIVDIFKEIQKQDKEPE